MIAAAGEAPAAAEPMTAGHRFGRSVRRDARRRNGVGIFAPHVALRLFRKIADHPAVLAVHGGDPGRRAAALRQGAEHFREHAVVGGEAAEHRGLQAAGQPEALEIVDGFFRQAALGGGLFGALAQCGNERAGALDEDFGVSRVGTCGGCHRVIHVGTMPRRPRHVTAMPHLRHPECGKRSEGDGGLTGPRSFGAQERAPQGARRPLLRLHLESAPTPSAATAAEHSARRRAHWRPRWRSRRRPG